MMSNVKKKRCAADKHQSGTILFIAAALSLFPTTIGTDAVNAIYTFVTRTLGSAVQVLVLLAMGLVIYLATSKYGNIRLGEGKPNTARSPGCLDVYLCRFRFFYALLGGC